MTTLGGKAAAAQWPGDPPVSADGNGNPVGDFNGGSGVATGATGAAVHHAAPHGAVGPHR
jgi:hypothetical protein